VLALVNNLLQVHIPPTMFATCFYAILDPATGQLCYANAGHNLPYLSRNGEVIELRATGMPLGLMPDMAYPEEELTVAPSDLILFSTDGVAEAHDAARQMFGLTRLKELLQNEAHRDGVIEQVLTELRDFTGAEWEQEDDVTLVVVRKTA
jgi:sigma-B regulation protein RsbU (phosphoserine phosphatase)